MLTISSKPREVETAHAFRHCQELHEAGAMLTIGWAQTATEFEYVG